MKCRRCRLAHEKTCRPSENPDFCQACLLHGFPCVFEEYAISKRTDFKRVKIPQESYSETRDLLDRIDRNVLKRTFGNVTKPSMESSIYRNAIHHWESLPPDETILQSENPRLELPDSVSPYYLTSGIVRCHS